MTPWYEPEIMASEAMFTLLTVDTDGSKVVANTRFEYRWGQRIRAVLYESWSRYGQEGITSELEGAGLDSWVRLMDPWEDDDCIPGLADSFIKALPALSLLSRLLIERLNGCVGSRLILQMLDLHFLRKDEHPTLDVMKIPSMDVTTAEDRERMASWGNVTLGYIANLAREADSVLERACGDWRELA